MFEYLVLMPDQMCKEKFSRLPALGGNFSFTHFQIISHNQNLKGKEEEKVKKEASFKPLKTVRVKKKEKFKTILKSSRRSASFSISRGSLVFLFPLLTSALPLANLADMKMGAGKRTPMQYPRARQPAPTKMALNQLKSILPSDQR